MINYEHENEKGSHRYDINRPRPDSNGHQYTKCKNCLMMMVLICIEHHLSTT